MQRSVIIKDIFQHRKIDVLKNIADSVRLDARIALEELYWKTNDVCHTCLMSLLLDWEKNTYGKDNRQDAD